MESEEEKVRDTRKDLIYSAAVTMMAQRGFEATSIRDICKAVGIKESSFYLYFSKKEELLTIVFQEFYDLFLKNPLPFDKLEQSLMYSSHPSLILSNALDCCFARLEDLHIRRLWQILIVEQFRDERAARSLRKMNRRLAQTAAELFKKWRQFGKIDASIDLNDTAECFASSVRMLFYDYLAQGKNDSFEHEKSKLIGFFISILKVDQRPENPIRMSAIQ